MNPDGTFAQTSLSRYLERLASANSTPGGGAAAAVTAAQGAALLSMVCNLTIGKKKFADVEDEVRSILDQCEAVRRVIVELGERDMVVFGEVMQAYRMPKATPGETALRNEAIQVALKRCSEVPFELFGQCQALLPHVDRLEKIGNPSVLSDVFVGRYLLVAALMSAMANVEVNLAAIEDEEFSKAKRKVMLAVLDTLGDGWRGLVGV